MFSRRFNTIFVHIPKTGGQSIEHVFLARHGLNWKARSELLLRHNRDPKRGPARLAHLYASEYIEYGYVPISTWAVCFKFATVRNPYDRAVSEYRYRAHRLDQSLREFVDRLQKPVRHTVPQWKFVLDSRDRMMVDRIIHFESLLTDFARISSELFGQAVELPHLNASPTPLPAGAFDIDVRRAIYAQYEKDFDLFKYPKGF